MVDVYRTESPWSLAAAARRGRAAEPAPSPAPVQTPPSASTPASIPMPALGSAPAPAPAPTPSPAPAPESGSETEEKENATPLAPSKRPRLVQARLGPEPTPVERIWRASPTPARHSTSTSNSSGGGGSPPLPLAAPTAALPWVVDVSSSSSGGVGTQLFLNLGQRHFSHTTCPVCHMVFVRGREDDDALHRRHHRAVLQGVHVDRVPPGATLTTSVDGATILCVTQDSPKVLVRKVRLPDHAHP
jgi:hypothetical protein